MVNSELPYAADAEVSLSYDELEVVLFIRFTAVDLCSFTGPTAPVREGAITDTRHCTDQI